MLDEEGRILAVNAAWSRYGQENGARSDYVGQNYVTVCAQAAAQGDRDAALILAGLKRVLSGQTRSYRHVYACGQRVFRLRVSAVTTDDGRGHVMAAHEDVTALAEAQRALRSATRHLMTIQEEERRRLAAELHNSTGQHLFAIKLGLRAIERGEHDPSTIETMRHALEEANRQIRSISYLLHAPRPDDDFRGSTRRLVQGFASRSGLSCHVTFRGRLSEVPQEAEQAFTRVLQEALLNVYRHANATRVDILLAMDRRQFKLKVADDGRSADVNSFEPGVGISSMASRLAPFSGRLTVTPSRHGTSVMAVIPIQEQLPTRR